MSGFRNIYDFIPIYEPTEEEFLNVIEKQKGKAAWKRRGFAS